jgi:hypothetical protein
MKGASSRGRWPGNCWLALPAHSFLCGEWSPGQWPCASEAGGAGAAPQNECLRSAGGEGLVLGPFLGELLGETAKRRNGPGPSGLVLRTGRQRGGNLTPLECLVEVVELWKDEFAVAVVLGACGLRLWVCACICSIAAA